MVLQICRKLTGDLQDAEDAAQAVFLVLARKATSLRVDGTVAPWLHGVARRVAAKARCRAAARRRAEIKTAGVAASLRGNEYNEPPGTEEWELVHEEVDRLPEKYRTPVVLCYLQGQSYEQAATRIGCPIGTIRVRLSRARDRLRGRLSRRGFGPERLTSISFFTADSHAILLPDTASIAGTLVGGNNWVEATVKAASALSIGRAAFAGTVSSAVLFFYESVIRTMMIDWCRTAAFWLLAAGMTVAGAIAFAASGRNEQGEGATRKRQAEAATAPKDDARQQPVDFDAPETLRKQIDRRVVAARQRLEAQRAYYLEGRITVDRFIDASQQLMLAEIAASTTKDQRVAAAKAHMDRATELVKLEQSELEKGRGTTADVAEALVAQENAACDYLQARQARDSTDLEALQKRVERLEKQLETANKELERSGSRDDRKSASGPSVNLDSPETLRKQTERRVIAARRRLEAQRKFYGEGRITIDRWIEASRQLMLAQTAAGATRETRLAAAKAHWDRMAEIQKREQAELDQGKGTVADLAEAVVAHEVAAFDYIAARQSKVSVDVDSLRQRIEAIEKQLEAKRKATAQPKSQRP
jgi:RNA polymerase sigma factor (sigma-70 family)